MDKPDEKVLLDNIGKIAFSLDKAYISRLASDYGVLYFDEKYNKEGSILYENNIRAVKVDRWVFDRDERPGECFKNVLSTFADGDHTIALTYDCYSNEKILESQKSAVQVFSKAVESIDSSLEEVKKYCLSMNREEIGAETIENIFKYVAPKYLFVPREEKKQIVAIMCNYKFDTESGIAIVFENGIFKAIGKQEIIL